ncbi:MAG: peroxiredoxin [Proteobacteria bacterium]|nr:peroxiredoxin [Pseudomonadota bacterium]
MLRTALCLSLLLSAAPVFAALPVGATAPDFATQGALAGKPFAFALKQALKKGPVVLYFYPKAFTSGCTVEAHEFAEATPEFNKLGATVIGMSGDDLDTLKRFSTEECRDKFAVATATSDVIKRYDVALPVMSSRSNRTSYVIAPNGKIVFAYSAMAPEGHVSGTLAAVKKWKGVK